MSHMIDDDFLYAHMENAENHLLASIPAESELDHKFSKRFLQKMKGLLKYERRPPAMRTFVQYAKRAAAVFLIVISIAFTTTMSVEAYRVRFFEFVTTVWEELTSVFISSDDNVEKDVINSVESYYVPSDYIVLERKESRYKNTIIYQNDMGSELYYSQILISQGEFIVDTENTTTNTTEIDNQIVYTLFKKDTVQVYWQDTFNIFSIIGVVEESELLRMADSIIRKENAKEK